MNFTWSEILIPVLVIAVVFGLVGCSAQTQTGVSFWDSVTEVGGDHVFETKHEVVNQREPFAIKRVYPEDNQDNLPKNAAVSIEFNRALDQASLRDSVIALDYINPDLGEEASVIAYEAEYVAEEDTLRLWPLPEFLPGETVQLTIKCDLLDEDGYPLEPDSDSYLRNICYTSQFFVVGE